MRANRSFLNPCCNISPYENVEFYLLIKKLDSSPTIGTVRTNTLLFFFFENDIKNNINTIVVVVQWEIERERYDSHPHSPLTLQRDTSKVDEQ